MSDHLVKIQIGEVFIQLLQILTFHFVDSFITNLIDQTVGFEVSINFNRVLTVRSGTIGKGDIRQIRIIRILPKFFLQIGVDQTFGGFRSMGLGSGIASASTISDRGLIGPCLPKTE